MSKRKKIRARLARRQAPLPLRLQVPSPPAPATQIVIPDCLVVALILSLSTIHSFALTHSVSVSCSLDLSVSKTVSASSVPRRCWGSPKPHGTTSLARSSSPPRQRSTGTNSQCESGRRRRLWATRSGSGTREARVTSPLLRISTGLRSLHAVSGWVSE